MRKPQDIPVVELVEAWQAPLYNYARRWLRDAVEAEDATQEIFIEILRNRGQVRDPQAFKAWVYRIAGRVLQRHARGRRLKAGAEALAEVPAAVAPSLEAAERRAILDTSVAALPERIREALHLKFYEGLNQYEVAAALNLPRSTVQSRIKKGLELLRESLALSGAAAIAPELEALLASPAPYEVPASLSSSLTKLSAEGKAAALIGGAAVSAKTKPLFILALALLLFGGGAAALILPNAPSAAPDRRSALGDGRAPRSGEPPKPGAEERADAARRARSEAREGAAGDAGFGRASPAGSAAEKASEDTRKSQLRAEAPREDSGAKASASGEGLWVTVLDGETLAPVKGARVRITGGSENDGRSRRSDAEGRVFLPGQTEGRGRIRVDYRGYCTFALREPGEVIAGGERVDLTASDLAEGLTVYLIPACAVSGRILDPLGRPIRARVSSDEGFSVRADERGEFRLDDLSPGRHQLQASHPDFPVAQASVTIASGDPVLRVELRFRQGFALSGQVLDDRGEPIADARVEATPASERGPFPEPEFGDPLQGQRRATRTDGDGRFRLKGLAPGSLDLIASAPGFAAGVRRALAFDESFDDVVELRLKEGGTIALRVLKADGSPAEGCPVTLSIKGFGAWKAGRVGADGRVAARGLMARPYRVRVHPPAGGWLEVPGVVPGPKERSLRLSDQVVIRGRVETEPGGPPLRRIACGYWSKTASDYNEVPVDAEGRFALTLSTRSRLTTLSFEAEGYQRREVEVSVRQGEPIDLILRLERAAVLIGRVVDGEGVPRSEVLLEVTARGEFVASDRSDRLGRFRLGGLPSGEVSLQAKAKEGAELRRELTLKAGEERTGFTIVLPRR